MKRFLKLLSAFLMGMALVLSAAVPACADVIWEPEDEFYQAHWEECTRVNRGYTLAGAGGSVELWSAPDGTVLKKLENGGARNIAYCWTDGGTEWGYTEWGLDDRDPGWVRMEDMKLIYDSQEFMKDHSEEIETVDPITVDFRSVKLFPYPNGPESRATVMNDLEESIQFETVYTDEAGLRWGYVAYQYGIRQRWICLDEPMIEGTDEPEAQEGAATGMSYQAQLILAAVLVAAVVIVTAVLVRRIPKRK